jgi:hypothetical protein
MIMKGPIFMGIVLCLCFVASPAVSFAAESGDIRIDGITYDDNEVTIDGTVGEGIKAVIWEIWREDCAEEKGGELKFFGSILDMSGGKYHSLVRFASEFTEGRYLVKVANYFGGGYSTAGFEVPFTSVDIPAVKTICPAEDTSFSGESSSVSEPFSSFAKPSSAFVAQYSLIDQLLSIPTSVLAILPIPVLNSLADILTKLQAIQ